MEFNEQDIKELCPKVKNVKEFTESLNLAFKQAEINNPLRVAAALARWKHESWDFQRMREVWTGTTQQLKYDPSSGSSVSKILGNTKPGDGIRFLGRGISQITGRYNYAAYSKYAGFDFLTYPEKLEQLPHAILSAAWFWTTKKLNPIADKGDIVKIVKIINGGDTGLQDTINNYKKYLEWFKKKGF